MTESLLPVFKLLVALCHSLCTARWPTEHALASPEYLLAMLARGRGPLELLWVVNHGEGRVNVVF